MDENIISNEIELIKNYQEKNDENIALYFFNKYNSEILDIVYGKINLKFSSIPLERDDFFHVVWKAVLQSLKNFDLEKGKSFKNYVIGVAYLMSIKEVLKFLKNDHLVLNQYYSYEKILEEKGYINLGESGKIIEHKTFEQARDELIEDAIKLNRVFDINLLKRVIYLRSLGHSNREISLICKTNKRRIDKLIKYVCKVAKKLYD